MSGGWGDGGANTDPGFGVLGFWGLAVSGIRGYGVNFHEREGDGETVMGSGMSRTGRECSVSSGQGRGTGHHISTKGGTSIEEIRDAHPAFGRQQCAVCSEIRSSHSVCGTEKYMWIRTIASLRRFVYHRAGREAFPLPVAEPSRTMV